MIVTRGLGQPRRGSIVSWGLGIADQVVAEAPNVIEQQGIGQGDGPRHMVGVGRIHTTFPHRTAFFPDEQDAPPRPKKRQDVPRETSESREDPGFTLADSYAAINRATALANEMAAREADRALAKAQQEAKRVAAIKALIIAVAIADDD